MRNRSWKVVALLAVGVAIGVSITATPAVGHVAGWVHNWNKHIKPRTDARYYTKAAADARYYTQAAADARYLRHDSTLRPGETISGTFGAAGGSGYAFTEIDFHPMLPASITATNAHYLTTGSTSAECPGPGQAAPGHLCAYESYASSVTFGDFTDPYSGAVGVKPIGTVLWWSVSSASSFVRGSWTARAPLASSARAGERASGGGPSPSPAR